MVGGGEGGSYHNVAEDLIFHKIYPNSGELVLAYRTSHFSLNFGWCVLSYSGSHFYRISPH